MKKLLIGLVIPLLVLFSPAAAMAATAPATTSDTANSTSSPGPTAPTGPDANTYTYNSATGNWENAYYIWNPTTQQTTPKTTPTYTYNSATGTYDTSKWQYNAASGQYEAVPESVTTPPTGATTVGGPSTGQSASNTNTKPSSTTNGSNTNTNGLNNTIGSTATSGDATVNHNTTGGSATTGNASAIANVINLLQSSIGSNSGVTTFTANIPGDVNGNLMVDPASIAQNQGSVPLQDAQAVTVHNQNDGQINNAILLNASSGNAGVVANTTAGSATSGNADAVANVVNVMNSSVGAGQSFVGVINIQGDLTGDILLPSGFLDSLIADNAPSSGSATSGTANVSNNNNQSIANNVTTAASTGTANVAHNTQAGNATSGTAQTSLTVMNLTGSDIIGSNALLVFVNVGGTWTGFIMNAPGATSATLGGGISKNTTDNQQLTSTNTNNQAINNDITASARSGDATVADNTTAGNATSGDAKATVNLANLINSHISLAQWFGILFINVGGNWNGSLTTAPPVSNDPAPGTATGGSSAGGGQAPVFQFVPHAAASGGSRSSANTTVYTTGSGSGSNDTPLVNLTSTHADNSGIGQVLGHSIAGAAQTGANSRYNAWFPLVGLLLSFMLLGADRARELARRH